MKFYLSTLLGISLITLQLQAENQEQSSLTGQKEKVSYAIGLNLGKELKRQMVEAEVDLIARGIRDALSGTNVLLTDKEVRETLTELQTELRAKQEERNKQLGEKNLKEGKAFLEENKEKEGIITLPSGLQYKVLQEGQGESPKETDQVTVHYRGTLIDGTEFDSSHSRGEPATFPVNGVIRGWTEALQLMKPGAKWMLYIPAELGYGEHGTGGPIGPNATLIFEVELLKVNKEEKPQSN